MFHKIISFSNQYKLIAFGIQFFSWRIIENSLFFRLLWLVSSIYLNLLVIDFA